MHDKIFIEKHLIKIGFVCTKWRLIDSHWCCVNDSSITDCLADYLWSFGFSIPECITYCLADNGQYQLKYRVFGGTIITYIIKLNN